VEASSTARPACTPHVPACFRMTSPGAYVACKFGLAIVLERSILLAPNVVIWLLAFLISIRGSRDSNLDRGTNCSRFSLVPTEMKSGNNERSFPYTALLTQQRFYFSLTQQATTFPVE
jgi:hypothetical protein